jgi:hypothetical protein
MIQLSAFSLDMAVTSMLKGEFIETSTLCSLEQLHLFTDGGTYSQSFPHDARLQKFSQNCFSQNCARIFADNRLNFGLICVKIINNNKYWNLIKYR